jgi:predicted membrane-bound spermidine synthase
VALMPYNLSLAAGDVRPSMIGSMIGVVVYALTLAALAPRLGVMAGAIGAGLVNLVGVFIYAHFLPSRSSFPVKAHAGSFSTWLCRF